jgi:uncharacterized OsmC-like protein
MDAAELRALQAPLKQAYKDDPARAHVRMVAESTIRLDQPAAELNTAAGSVVAGLHPAAGGDGSQACSGDMLLQALVACSGVTFSAVAIALGIPIDEALVRATGAMDFRGTLGIDRTVPVGITDIELQFEIRSSAEDAQLAKLVELTERYCVVLQTLQQPARWTCSWQRG